MNSSLRHVAAATLCLSAIAFPSVSLSADGDCTENLDACVKMVVAETATFVEECGKHFPQYKQVLTDAFGSWSVLKLPIPGIEEATDPKSPLRLSMSQAIAPYLKSIPGFEKEIECSGRLEMIRNAKPTLRGDSAPLPPDALGKYTR